MDLSDYTCRGFPGEFDALMRDVPVVGIDRAQTHSMIRLCEETEAILYGDFSPRRVRYVEGSRPRLQEIVHRLHKDPLRAMQWVREHVQHPNFACKSCPPDRGMSEEQLIDSGIGWCNEQSRVFIALCELMEIPARLAFLFHANGRTSHTATEVRLDGKWVMFDVTHGVRVRLPDRSFAEARELSRRHRALAHAPYQAPLAAYYRGKTPPFDLSRGGDLFEAVGICNYIIDGVEALRDE
jgi:transglutaminase-like putative cysteine protease